MRWFSPRIRIRSLMVLVAVVALALGYDRVRQRWVYYRAMARYHAEHEEGCLWTGDLCQKNVAEYVPMIAHLLEQGDKARAQACVEHSAKFAEEAGHQFKKATHHALMRRYYENRW